MKYTLVSVLPLLALSSMGSAAAVTSQSSSPAVTTAPKQLISSPEWTRKDLVIHPKADSSSAVGMPQADLAVPTVRLGVVLALISQNTVLAGAVCTATGGTACIVAAIVATIASYALLFVPTAGPDNPAKRAVEGVSAQVHDHFLLGDGSTPLDAMRSSGIEDQWVEYGNATIDGVQHTMHFHKTGNMMGVRAVRTGAGNEKRDDRDDDEGVVATYFWEDNNQDRWNKIHGYDMSPVGKYIGNYAIEKTGDIICADLEEDSQPIDVGVITLDNNNDELGLMPSQWNSAMGICKKGE